MVITSVQNWDLHKKQVYEKIKERYNKDYASKFIDFYEDRYDEHGRSFVHYPLAFKAKDDYEFVKSTNTRFIAIVGPGGTGKSTLANNLAYLYDDTFLPSERSTTKIKYFVDILQKLPKRDSMKSVVMDEPEYPHPSSKIGKKVNEVFGKCRAQSLFFIICATDMGDIPPIIYKKIQTVIFTPYRGAFFLFRDEHKKFVYVVQEIRNKYMDLGYKVFLHKSKKAGCLRGATHKSTPFTDTENAQYIEDKTEDYSQTLNEAKAMFESKVKKKVDPRITAIVNMTDQGYTQKEIGKIFNMSRSNVSRILKKHKEAEWTKKRAKEM